jgi:hypothetical protein
LETLQSRLKAILGGSLPGKTGASILMCSFIENSFAEKQLYRKTAFKEK